MTEVDAEDAVVGTGLCVCCLRLSNLISVPSAFLSTIFLVRGGLPGMNVLALVFRRAEEEGVGGGEERPPTLLEDEWCWESGGGTWWVEGTACDCVGVPGPLCKGMG